MQRPAHPATGVGLQGLSFLTQHCTCTNCPAVTNTASLSISKTSFTVFVRGSQRYCSMVELQRSSEHKAFGSTPVHYIVLVVTDFCMQIKRITVTTTSAAVVWDTGACVSKEPTILQPVHPQLVLPPRRTSTFQFIQSNDQYIHSDFNIQQITFFTTYFLCGSGKTAIISHYSVKRLVCITA